MTTSSLQRWRSGLGRRRVFSGGEFCALLARDMDFARSVDDGSHVVMQKTTDDSTITVPVPDHKEIRIGTLQSIIRRSQFEV
jgi:predicted RNA binding protein YcfA (HicA-like mRNA interferase family)